MKATAVRRLLTSGVMTGALLVSSAGMASAQSWSVADPKGDVQRASSSSPDAVLTPETLTAEPNRRAGDVWRTAASHTRTSVVIRITMQALPTRNWMGMTTIRTPSTSYDLFHMRFGGRTWVSLTKTHGNGAELRCAAKSTRIDGNAVVLTVARKCLGYPRTVRVGAGVAAFDTSDMSVAHVDDAGRRGYLGAGNLRLGPLLRRG